MAARLREGGERARAAEEDPVEHRLWLCARARMGKPRGASRAPWKTPTTLPPCRLGVYMWMRHAETPS